MQGACVFDLPPFQGRWLNRKNIYFLEEFVGC
jgi:hypothetical protein